MPRQYLSKRGLRSFWRLEPAARVRLLQELLGPSYPSGAVWDTPIERARTEGRFRIEASVNGADQVIAATGFLRGYRHDPLLARLAEDYGLETADRWLVLDPDCTVPVLTDRTRTLAVSGVAGQYAYPAADTLAGARYAGHAFLRRCRTR